MEKAMTEDNLLSALKEVLACASTLTRKFHTHTSCDGCRNQLESIGELTIAVLKAEKLLLPVPAKPEPMTATQLHAMYPDVPLDTINRVL